MPTSLIRNRLTKQITSVSLDKEDLRRLLNILQEHANSASEIEYLKFQNQNVDNIEQIKSDLDKCAVLKISIKGNNNEELFGTIDEVFNSNSFPENITTLYLNSDLNYTSIYKYNPDNSFSVLLDFSTPKVFDFSLQPSERTPNDSMIIVQGSNTLWVNGAFFKINSFIDSKPAKYSKIHQGSTYDLLVWFLGIPFAFNFASLNADDNIIYFLN